MSSLSPKKTEPFTALANFANVNLNFKYSTNGQSNYYCEGCFNPFDVKNEIFSRIIILIVIIIPLLFLGVQWIMENCVLYDLKESFKKRRIANICDKVYNVIVFPISIGFIFEGVITFSIMSHLNLIFIAVTVALTIIVSLIFFSKWRIFLCNGYNNINDASMKASYVPVYLTFSYSIFTFILLANHGVISSCSKVLLFLIGFFFTWFVFMLPYKQNFHNFGEIFNLLFAMCFIGWTVAREYLPSAAEEECELFYLFLFSSMMVLMVIIAIVRIIIEAKSQLLSKDIERR